MEHDAITGDPALVQLRAALVDTYGQRLARVLLYGSRARCDGGGDSDYDVAVFLDGIQSRWAEMQRLAAIELAIMDRTGAFIHTVPLAPAALQDQTMFMHEVRKDGRDLL